MTLEFLLPLAGILLGAGALMGFLSGLFGIGGGAMIVPVLFELFGRLGVAEASRLHMAIGTSLAIMIPTTIRSYLGHRARGAVDEALLRRLAPFVVLGIVLGTMVAAKAAPVVLKWTWAVVMTLLALKVMFARASWRLGSEIPKSRFVEVFATAMGLLSTIMSIGGGVFMTTFMTLYNRPLLQSIATASGIGPIIAVPGAIGFVRAGWGAEGLPPYSLGYVSLIGAICVIPSSVLAAPFGVALAHRIPKRWLEIAFAAFLAVIAARFVTDLLRA